VAAAVLLSSSSPARNASATGLAPGETTTVVSRRTLSESSTVDGTLGYGGALQLYDRLAGTFTWLPAVGAVIGRGATLYRVDDLPVVLMYGSLPAYRALQAGVSDGPDVAELNRNLRELGFDPYGAIGEDAHFGSATAAAVRRWQSAKGLAQTGEVPLGRIVFAPGARRVTAVHVALGQDPPGEAPADTPAATAPTTPAATTPTTTPTAKTPTAKTPTEGKAPAKAPARRHKPRRGKKGRKGTKKPARAPTAKSPARKSPAKAAAKGAEAEGAAKSPGGGKEPSAGAGELVLSTTSTQQLVQLAVKAEQQRLAHVGESAPVTLPDGEVVRGHITDVGTVASESQEEEKNPAAEKGGGGGGGGGGESATIAVTLALDRRVARLDQAPVSVELVKEVRHGVLSVPATALTATAGGGYAIEVLEGGRRRERAVTPGMFADGYVQVEGPGVRAGLTVTESQ
jgi:peptidoglycan hydrolase-like protein with peptidoglycan-binding domain